VAARNIEVKDLKEMLKTEEEAQTRLRSETIEKMNKMKETLGDLVNFTKTIPMKLSSLKVL
jgi:hypothetical protein